MMRREHLYSQRSPNSTASPRIDHAVSMTLEPLEHRALLCALHLDPNQKPIELPFTPVEGGPEGPADIVWINRGQASDGFAATFGANAETARNVIDAVILAFERMIGSFNYSDGSSNFNLTVNMNGGNSNGAFASLGSTLGGKPKSGTIGMGRGANGQGSGWFLDPTPHDHSEFQGPIVNAYSSDATPGGPADGLGDFYTVAAAEITHVLGLFGNALPLWSSRTSNTFIPDTAEGGGTGTFWVFQGPSIRHLLTSNNGGPGGQNFGSAVHGAGPGVSVNFGGQTYIGAQDIGNAVYEFSRRYIPSNTFALMFKDAFSYGTVDPAQFGTFYTMRDPATGQVTVRGGSNSNDIITVSTSGSTVTLSVDIGSDVPGTGSLPGAGNLPAFVTTYDIADISSIVIQAGDGADTVNVNGLHAAVPLTIQTDVGNDTINLNNVPAGATVNVQAGFGDDTISLGGGNLLANLLGTVNIDGGDGADTIFFNDSASSGSLDYTIDSSSFTIAGNPIGFSGAEAVRLDANAFNNTVRLDSTVFNRPFTVNGGSGDDTFILGAGMLSNLPATITLNGQAGNDTIVLDDSATNAGQFYFVESTNVTRAGFGPLLHSTIETVRLLADAGASAIIVNSTAAGLTTIVNGGAGIDAIAIDETHAASPVVVEPSAGTDNVRINLDGIGAAAAVLQGPLTRLGHLTIGAGGLVSLAANGSTVLIVEQLTVNGSGKLDLADNTMILDYSFGNPIAEVRNLLINGFNNGLWNGSGMVSSSAAADATNQTALGYSHASELFSSFPAQFAGQQIDQTSVLIRHTLYGDANLDRQVNLLDFNRLASSFGSGSSWALGDFNYDDLVNLSDFNLLAANFGDSL